MSINKYSYDFEIKNYRCFVESEPLRFTLRDFFMAFVGPNNSGKSAALKMIYEMRTLWNHMANPTHFFNNLGSNQSIKCLGLLDSAEIFNDDLNRDIEIKISINNAQLYDTGEVYVKDIILNALWEHKILWVVTAFDSTGNSISAGGNIDAVKSIYTRGNNPKYEGIELLGKMLGGSFYVPPFRNAITEGNKTYYDLNIGTSFITVWNQWKTGHVKEQNKAITSVTNDIRKIFKYDSLEILASQDGQSLQLNIDGKPYKLNEVGSGISQFIVVLGNIAIKKPTILLIDEPELHLHPSLQSDFLMRMASYVSDAVIFSTHSLGLARTVADSIYSFVKVDGHSKVQPFDGIKNYVEFLGEMSFSAYQELGVDILLLVEGVKDVKVFRQFLRALKIEGNVLILPLGGDQLASGNVEHELSELLRITNNVYAIVDSERDKAESPPKKERIDFEKLCKKLGIKACLTERKAIENYFSDRAIKAALGGEYSFLNEYGTLKNANKPWSKSINWKIAQQMKWEEIKETDIGRFLEQLVQKQDQGTFRLTKQTKSKEDEASTDSM